MSASNYTVSLVGIDGRIIASAVTATPAAVTCANATAALVPMPTSTSNSRAYFMDAQGVVRYLASNGDLGRATTVPIGPARRSSFAVSPDDQRIAVVVIDFTANGATTKLYVEDLNGGGNHRETFNDSGAFTLWATGWHGTDNLVVAKVPACVAGSGLGCCSPWEFHVVDPNTAFRRFTVGSTICKLAGPPSPAGAMCQDDAGAKIINWTGGVIGGISLQNPVAAYLSPSGGRFALVAGAETEVRQGQTFADSRKFPGIRFCGWIDDTHIFSGGDAQQQPRVGDVTDGKVIPVAAQGDCAGRIPGGL